jgi:DNA-binding Lrp family transcriptional regulator
MCGFEELLNTKYNSPNFNHGARPSGLGGEHVMGDWTFFSNYGHVLVCLERDHEARLRDVAADVGITERAAQKIVKDLQDAGYLTATRHGRRNRYQINKRKSLRHDLQAHCTVGKLLAALKKSSSARRSRLADQPEQETEQASVPVRPAAEVPEEVVTRYPSVAEESPAADQALEKKPGKKPKSKPFDTREQGTLF